MYLCGSGSVVERCLAKADIAGPNPVSRSIKTPKQYAWGFFVLKAFLYTVGVYRLVE